MIIFEKNDDLQELNLNYNIISGIRFLEEVNFKELIKLDLIKKNNKY